MRRVAELQQELVGAQQAMEREYMQLRQTETRYRALFQMAAEAVLIVDAANRRIVDANPAAIRLLETTAGELIGRTFPDAIGSEDEALVTEVLSGVRRTGRAAAELIRLGGAGGRTNSAAARPVRRTPDSNSATSASSSLPMASGNVRPISSPAVVSSRRIAAGFASTIRRLAASTIRTASAAI